MNTNLIKPHHENFTEANKGHKDKFFVNFVAFCKVPLWIAILVLPGLGVQAAVVFATLYSFTGTNDGARPYAALVQGTDGNFYGTTCDGGLTNFNSQTGNSGYGTVFKITTNGVQITLHSFTGTNDGANPLDGLVQGNDGYFYGTTILGGTNGYGTVFKISTNGVLTTLYAFGTVTNADYELLDGANPVAGLVQGSDGYFYGTTYDGGDGAGTVFKISANGALTTLNSFDGSGFNPYAGLVQGSDGYFYGTTEYGGPGGNSNGDGYGSVFKISTNGALTYLNEIGADWGEGANPTGGLVQGSDGYFYGTTYGGWGGPGLFYIFELNGFPAGGGTVFKISTNGALTNLVSFSVYGDLNANPLAGLVQGSDGYAHLMAVYVELMLIAVAKNSKMEISLEATHFISESLENEGRSEVRKIAHDYSQAFASSATDGIMAMVMRFSECVGDGKMRRETIDQLYREFSAIFGVFYNDFRSIKLISTSEHWYDK